MADTAAAAGGGGGGGSTGRPPGGRRPRRARRRAAVAGAAPAAPAARGALARVLGAARPPPADLARRLVRPPFSTLPPLRPVRVLPAPAGRGRLCRLGQRGGARGAGALPGAAAAGAAADYRGRRGGGGGACGRLFGCGGRGARPHIGDDVLRDLRGALAVQLRAHARGGRRGGRARAGAGRPFAPRGRRRRRGNGGPPSPGRPAPGHRARHVGARLRRGGPPRRLRERVRRPPPAPSRRRRRRQQPAARRVHAPLPRRLVSLALRRPPVAPAPPRAPRLRGHPRAQALPPLLRRRVLRARQPGRRRRGVRRGAAGARGGVPAALLGARARARVGGRARLDDAGQVLAAHGRARAGQVLRERSRRHEVVRAGRGAGGGAAAAACGGGGRGGGGGRRRRRGGGG